MSINHHRITLGPATFAELVDDNGRWTGWANVAPPHVGNHATEDDARNALVVALSTMLHRLVSGAVHGPVVVAPLSTLTAMGVDASKLVAVDIPPAAMEFAREIANGIDAPPMTEADVVDLARKLAAGPQVAPSLAASAVEVAHHTAGQPTNTEHSAGPLVVDTGASPASKAVADNGRGAVVDVGPQIEGAGVRGH